LISGQKFSQIEVVMFLVMVLGKWDVSLADGWTVDRAWEVLDMSGSILTLAPPVDIPLKFQRRTL
jgi:hypothetical protein